MAAYAIANVKVTDTAKFHEYGLLVPATVENMGVWGGIPSAWRYD
ncbi:DUF1330 domain-containing protein [SAR202 cluster bacterium AC-647-N09_OGT_505m]|nr:DUF1330 domain-containing protein [SAR202 cluster bacterium AC-647-N09_OGT_505m]